MENIGNLRKAQLGELEILKLFKKICEEENLSYFLLGGTAIGAVRHKGFIPWDDDIDVGLLRNDYEKFLCVANKYLPSNIKIYSWKNKKDYSDYTMKMVNTNMKFVTERTYGNITQEIWIDIFPLDGIPNPGVIRNVHYLKMKYYRMLLGMNNIDEDRIIENRSSLKKQIYKISKTLGIHHILNGEKIKKKLDSQLSKFSVDKSAYIGNLMGAYHEREVFPKDVFFSKDSQILQVQFEDDYFRVPVLLDKYLSIQYGDYMKLPPVEKQRPKHNVIKIIEVENYEN